MNLSQRHHTYTHAHTHLWEIVEAEDSGRSDGQVTPPRPDHSGERRPVPTAVVGHGFVLTRQEGQSSFYRLGDGEARVVDDVPEVGVGQQVLPFVDLVNGEQHRLRPAESTEIEPDRDAQGHED